MADTKVTALTADTDPATTDLAYFVKDPGGTPLSRKITLANLSKAIDHDVTANFVADEHIDHSGVTITAGAGMTGGGTIEATRTLNVIAGDGIAVAADAVAVDITNAADKGTPVAADEILIGDSAAAGAIKKADAQSVVDGTTALTEGKFTIWVPANAMTPATTSGAATGQLESSTHKVNIETLDFDTAADEYAHFNLAMPKSWNLGTITFQVFWSTTNASTNTVAWGLEAVAFANSDALDTDHGTPIVVSDAALSAALDVLVTAESSAMTIAGSPGDDELVNFRFFRDVSADNMTEDALLLGIKLFFTIDLANDD